MICASCGNDTLDDTDLCRSHPIMGDMLWAATNKLMCDFFHRHLIPPRVPIEIEDPDLGPF